MIQKYRIHLHTALTLNDVDMFQLKSYNTHSIYHCFAYLLETVNKGGSVCIVVRQELNTHHLGLMIAELSGTSIEQNKGNIYLFFQIRWFDEIDFFSLLTLYWLVGIVSSIITENNRFVEYLKMNDTELNDDR